MQWKRPLEADSWAIIRKELHQHSSPDDFGSINQVVGVQTALGEAGSAHVDGAADGSEVIYELLQGEESLLVDIIGVPLLGEADTLGAEEDHRILLRAKCGAGYDKSDGRFIGIVLGAGQVNTERNCGDYFCSIQ